MLVDREAELAELAEFCIGVDQPGYALWQAPARAGKSALMSWFALHPPQQMNVVSFFITARLPSQNDRSAFADVVIEQLAALTKQEMPTYLTEATKEAHLLELLNDAAMQSARADRRLVLVVDGLDQDPDLRR
jgi:ATP/maltotriose-dependent transcriptional regulator MalT